MEKASYTSAAKEGVRAELACASEAKDNDLTETDVAAVNNQSRLGSGLACSEAHVSRVAIYAEKDSPGKAWKYFDDTSTVRT